MKRVFITLVGVVCLALFSGGTAHAVVSVRVAPLEYRTILAKGEKQKGFVDVTNPSGTTQTVRSSVQAFRQKDSSGALEFYDDARLQAGVVVDLATIKLAAHETMRVYFLIDGAKLPEGDVFAALMFSVASRDASGTSQVGRVGSLLSITNATPGQRAAEVTQLDADFFQFGDGVSGSYRIKNTGDTENSTGFFPEVDASLSPFAAHAMIRSSLVFAGHERGNELRMKTDRFGLYVLRVEYQGSYKEQWVFLTTGYWRVLAPILLVLTGAVTALQVRRRLSGRRMMFKRGQK